MPDRSGQPVVRCGTDRQQRNFRRFCPDRIGKRTVPAALQIQFRDRQTVDFLVFDRRDDFLIFRPNLVRGQRGIPDCNRIERGGMIRMDMLRLDPVARPDGEARFFRGLRQFHRDREFFRRTGRRNFPVPDEQRRLCRRPPVDIQIHRLAGPGHGDLVVFSLRPVRRILSCLDLRAERFLALIRHVVLDRRRNVIRP